MSLKDAWRRVRPKVLAGIAYSLVRTLGSLSRVRRVGFEKLDGLSGAIINGWHGRSLLFANLYRGQGYWVIISQSKDGELQASIFRKLGYNIIRGSTGRGGVRAAVEGIRALRSGGKMALTPDGPRGPSRIVQGGVMTMAQKSGAALLPIGISAKRRILIKSWDRYMLPLPFTPAIMILGDPFYVLPEDDEETVEQKRLHLQSEMNRLEEEAERAMGHGG